MEERGLVLKKLICHRLALSLILLVLGVIGQGYAAGLPEAFKNTAVPWHIRADKMTYDRARDVTTAIGNAVIEKEDFRLSADRIEYSRSRNEGVAEGHVVVTAGGDRMTGRRMEMDLANGTGTLYDGTLFLKRNHYLISGKKIQKTGERSYSAESVHVTTCDGETPDWAITGSRLDITIDGYGVLRNAAFRIKEVPVLYTPFFAFPAKVKRQTGLLVPEFGNSSRKGFEFIQPFFWAINDQMDATFYEHYMSLRGNKLGGEFRWVQSQRSHGTIMFDGFKDRQVDDGKGDHTANYGYADDTALRPNTDRYWFRMKEDQELPAGFTAQLDLDVVSDQDYLHEFKSGYTGFDASDAYFETYFGRDLDDYTDPVRTNRLNLNRLWPSASLNIELRWLDDVIARRQGTTDETVQRLPRITLDSARRNLFDTLLQIGVDSEYAYFYREDGARGHRVDLHPRFYLPFRLGAYLSVEPSVGLRETAWHLDRSDGLSDDTDRTLHREYYDAQLEIASEQYRIYSLHTRWADALKHISRFQVDYDYVPETDQSEYPVFDAADRIENTNRITYAWIHTLISRSIVKAGGGPAGSPQAVSHRYQQLARLKFEQEYDIDKARENLPEPFSPITTELEINLGQAVSLKADAGWSPYSHQLVSQSIQCYLSDARGDKLHIEQRYTKDTEESLYLEMIAKITPWLWVSGNFERNYHTGENLNRGINFSYRTQCWSFNIGYGKEEDDERLTFAFTLYGLGDFGSGTPTTGLSPFVTHPLSGG
jgi:LPS-assembly protein